MCENRSSSWYEKFNLCILNLKKTEPKQTKNKFDDFGMNHASASDDTMSGTWMQKNGIEKAKTNPLSTFSS